MVHLEVYIARKPSAVEARIVPNFVIIARTDARQTKKFGGEKQVEKLSMKESGGLRLCYMLVLT